jgi:recombination associated protein RdgC
MKPLEMIEHGRFLGEEFILWLWMRGLAEGGTSGREGDTSACFLDDEVTLVTERGDVKELGLRKGNPPESLEAFEALSRGMRPCRAKLRIMAGDMEWTFTLSAAQLEISAMRLPPSQAKDMQGRVSDRLFLLEEGAGHLERRFAIFLEQRSGAPEALKGEMKAWIEDGLAQTSGSGGEAPWGP